MLEAGVEQVRGVADELAGVALLAQERRDVVRPALVDRLPAGVGPAEHAGGEVGALRDGREAAHGEALDLGGPIGSEAVEFGRPDGLLGAVAEVIVAKRVGDHDDDVLHGTPCPKHSGCGGGESGGNAVHLSPSPGPFDGRK